MKRCRDNPLLPPTTTPIRYYIPILHIIKSFHSVKYNIYANINIYADDIEIHADCHQSSHFHLQSCFTSINNWLTNNYLLLNRVKLTPIRLKSTYEFFTSESLPTTIYIYINVPIGLDKDRLGYDL